MDTVPVKGLLLQLLNDRGAPGDWFWPCFEPLRPQFDRHYWVFTNQPWMGPPEGFDEDDTATDEFEGVGQTSVMLWRPGTLGRWADEFAEEFVELWAVDPADNPAYTAAQFQRDHTGRFKAEHAVVWLLYTDSTCWEIFARDACLLQQVRDQVAESADVHAHESTTEDRGEAFRRAGIESVWRAMHGMH